MLFTRRILRGRSAEIEYIIKRGRQYQHSSISKERYFDDGSISRGDGRLRFAYKSRNKLPRWIFNYKIPNYVTFPQMQISKRSKNNSALFDIFPVRIPSFRRRAMRISAISIGGGGGFIHPRAGWIKLTLSRLIRWIRDNAEISIRYRFGRYILHT